MRTFECQRNRDVTYHNTGTFKVHSPVMLRVSYVFFLRRVCTLSNDIETELITFFF